MTEYFYQFLNNNITKYKTKYIYNNTWIFEKIPNKSLAESFVIAYPLLAIELFNDMLADI